MNSKRKPSYNEGYPPPRIMASTDANKMIKRRKIHNSHISNIINDSNIQNMSNNNNSIETQNSKQQRQLKDIIIADSPSQLPKHCIEKLFKSDLPLNLCEKFWEITLNILHFKTKQNFCTTSQFENNEFVHRQTYFVPKEDEIQDLMTHNFNLKDYNTFESIGKGGYGMVFSAFSLHDQCRIAIKKVPHSNSKQRRKNFLEINTLIACSSHPNIIRFVRSHMIDKEIWIVTELVNGGTLSQASKIFRFTEEQISYIARKILKAIHFIHSKNYVHRDLKGSNIMIDKNGNVKIIDFGLCWNIQLFGESRNMVGSPFWMPPEMIRRDYHGMAADIWSFGICLMELINQQPPNKKSSIRAMFVSSTVGHPDPFEAGQWSNEMRHFMSKCLCVDPSQRWTTEQLLSHSWLKHRSSKKEMQDLFHDIWLVHDAKKKKKHVIHNPNYGLIP